MLVIIRSFVMQELHGAAMISLEAERPLYRPLSTQRDCASISLCETPERFRPFMRALPATMSCTPRPTGTSDS